MITTIHITDYLPQGKMVGHDFKTNCYHVSHNGKSLYGTIGEGKESSQWLDEKHQRITAALRELESALLDSVK